MRLPDAIVPAFNEAPTVAMVVRALLDSRAFRNVVVADDGSTDGTAQAARAAGAHVLRLTKNRGKGGAMQAAYRALPADGTPVAFFDSDLLGFAPQHARTLVTEHQRLGALQTIGMRDHGGPLLASAALLMPIISGERIVERCVLDRIPFDCWNGYAIETAINDIADRLGGTTVLVPMRGVHIRGKISKTGLMKGTADHLKMFRQIANTRAALRSHQGASCSVS